MSGDSLDYNKKQLMVNRHHAAPHIDEVYYSKVASSLVGDVIAKIDSDHEGSAINIKVGATGRMKGADPDADRYSSAPIPENAGKPPKGDKKGKKKRKRLTKRRQAEVPDF